MKIQLKFFICGLFSSLLFPPFFILPIGFIVFPILFYLLIDEKFLNKNKFFQFNSGIIYGLGFNLIILIWIKEPFYINKNTSSFSSFSYLLVFYCSIFYGFIFLIIGFFKNYISKLIIIPVLFVLSEVLRENISFGFPWITFASVYSGNKIILNLIYYFGTYGLSYLTIFVFLLPIPIVLLHLQNSFTLKIYILISLIIIFFSTILIIARFEDQLGNQNDLQKNINVSLIQLNVSQEEKSSKNNAATRLQNIENIIQSSESELLVFAENNYPYLISDLNNLKFLSNHLKENQSIIIGGIKKNKFNFHNTFIFIDKNKIDHFDKIILVPFGEFLPFRNLLNFLSTIVGSNDFSIGSEERIINTSNNLKILPVICYEIIFFNNLLNLNNSNSELIVNITNDDWFGILSGPYQHFYLSRMRAVEFNKTLVRVSNNGISAIIDNKGEILDFIPLNKRDIKNLKISLSSSNNLINYHSLFFLIFCILFIFAIVINRKFSV